jgi:hypothetical protein
LVIALSHYQKTTNMKTILFMTVMALVTGFSETVKIKSQTKEKVAMKSFAQNSNQYSEEMRDTVLVIFKDRAEQEYYTKAIIAGTYKDAVMAFELEQKCAVGQYTITGISGDQKYCGKRLFLYYRP